ncbi:MAG: phosphotransferase [Pseudomonadota bacterium]
MSTGAEREALVRDFLDASGWALAQVAPLAGDASNRRYLRVHTSDAYAVLMDAPPERGEDVRPFVAVSEWLVAQGFSAPQIFAADPERGFLLIEDLGDALYARHLEGRPGDEDLLYGAAVDLLLRTSELPVPATMGREARVLEPYDIAVLERESALVTEWWMPAASGACMPDDLDAEFRELLVTCCTPVADARSVLVQRDYHAENLLWLPHREGHARVGLLDYQDALAGHPAYDLMSLLEDARRDTSPALQEAMLSRYLAARPELDEDVFRRDYAVLGAQRNLKIVGIFARLCARDGKPGYLDLIPRVWGHLMQDLSHPDLSGLRDWVMAHVPAPEPSVLQRIRAGEAS